MYLIDVDQIDLLKNTFILQAAQYEKQEAKKEKKNEDKMTISISDLKLIWKAGVFTKTDEDLEVAIAFFWLSIGNNDRSAEKIETTLIQDMQEGNWQGISFIKRDPEFVQKKVKNKRTRRSYGVIPYIEGAGEDQPYCIVKVHIILYDYFKNILFSGT